MRKLALDVGEKRIGVAISDSTCTVVSSLTTIERKNGNFLEKLKTLIQKHDIGEIIVGIPFKINGTEGTQAKRVRKLAKQIRNELNIPVKEWDERYTSLQAEKNLIFDNVRRLKRKSFVDQVAAALILQNYLDNLNRKM